MAEITDRYGRALTNEIDLANYWMEKNYTIPKTRISQSNMKWADIKAFYLTLTWIAWEA